MGKYSEMLVIVLSFPVLLQIIIPLAIGGIYALYVTVRRLLFPEFVLKSDWRVTKAS